MIRLLVVLALAMFAGGAALAQESRLDAIQKSGKLRVCTPGDYKPFSLAKPDGSFEGLDVDLVQAMAKALGVEVEIRQDQLAEADERLRREVRPRRRRHLGDARPAEAAFFTEPTWSTARRRSRSCENVAKFQTIADIDKPGVTVIENPGGSNERFARANFKQAKIVIFNDNTTIFDEILKGNADVMISESVETIVQQKLRPGPVRGQSDKPLQYGEMAWLLPRGDARFKAWVDQWLHLAKATGEYDRIVAVWLK